MNMDKKALLKNLRRIASKISPPVPVGGLQITDFAIRYVYPNRGMLARASMRLRPGVVQDGKIQDQEALIAALKELRLRSLPNRKLEVSVILSLPIRDVYVQPFSVPRIAEGNFEEAADLNARMISPIDVDKSYYGWQEIPSQDHIKNDLNLLGAFVLRDIADVFTTSLDKAGFGIAAVEFESISLVRNVGRIGILGKDDSYIVIEITPEGMKFIAVRMGIPHFHYLYPWHEVQREGKTITFESLENTLEKELNSVINFYSTHWSGEKLGHIIVITPSFEEEISKLISARFSELKLRVLKPTEVSVAYGAALRGALPRYMDEEISLASLSAVDVFDVRQVSNFVSLWRNVFVVTLGFLLAVFVTFNIFVHRESGRLTDEAGKLSADSGTQELNSLLAEADQFNALVDRISKIRSQSYDFSPFLLKLKDVAGADIEITRFSFRSISSPASLGGLAINQGAAIAFKNRLAEQPQLSSVKLPLSSISVSGNKTAFSLTFKLDSLNFSQEEPESTSEGVPTTTQEEPTPQPTEDHSKETTLVEELQSASQQLDASKPEATEPLVIFGNINFTSISEPVTLEVSAVDRDTAFLFRNLLEASPSFYNVSIISNVVDSTDGRVRFTIQFSVSL